MPTVLNIDAARVMIYPRDHPPEHVHVLEADKEAIFVLNCPEGPVSLLRFRGCSSGELRRYKSALDAAVPALCKSWEAIYADR